MSEGSVPSRMGFDGEGDSRSSGETSVLDPVRNVASKSSKQSRPKEDRIAAHAERVRRCRAILQFIREVGGKTKYPDFLHVAQQAVWKNELFPNTQRKVPDIALSMKMLWMKRVYWESDEAFTRQLSGGPI